MDFLTFALPFYSTICIVALLNILFFLFSQNLLMLNSGLIKKTKLPCSQQVFVLLDRRFIESLYILSIGIHLSGE